MAMKTDSISQEKLFIGQSKLHVHGTTKLIYFFQDSEFTRSNNWPTVYFKKEGNGDILVVVLYVNDMIYFGSSKFLVDDFKTCMMSKFEVTELGSLFFIFFLWGSR